MNQYAVHYISEARSGFSYAGWITVDANNLGEVATKALKEIKSDIGLGLTIKIIRIELKRIALKTSKVVCNL